MQSFGERRDLKAVVEREQEYVMLESQALVF